MKARSSRPTRLDASVVLVHQAAKGHASLPTPVNQNRLDSDPQPRPLDRVSRAEPHGNRSQAQAPLLGWRPIWSRRLSDPPYPAHASLHPMHLRRAACQLQRCRRCPTEEPSVICEHWRQRVVRSSLRAEASIIDSSCGKCSSWL